MLAGQRGKNVGLLLELCSGDISDEKIDLRQILREKRDSAAVRFHSVPCLSARSFISAKKTGTKISTWMVDVIIPPTIGAAMGFITSEPIPVSQRIGMRLARTAHTVINFGLSRWTAPSITAASMSSCLSGTPVA